MEVKQVLEDAKGSYEKAHKELMKKVAKKAAKKSDRTANDGLVYSYIHNGGKIGSLILMGCETDFVAMTDDFKKLCHDVSMQICTEDYKDIKDILKAEFIKDPGKKISDIIDETIAKVGEKIELKKFVKFDINE